MNQKQRILTIALAAITLISPVLGSGDNLSFYAHDDTNKHVPYMRNIPKLFGPNKYRPFIAAGLTIGAGTYIYIHRKKATSTPLLKIPRLTVVPALISYCQDVKSEKSQDIVKPHHRNLFDKLMFFYYLYNNEQGLEQAIRYNHIETAELY